MLEGKKFKNLCGGSTEAYLSDGYTLAYLDLLPGGMADIDVVDPYKGTQRSYRNRTEANARGILERHLKRQNFSVSDTEWD